MSKTKKLRELEQGGKAWSSGKYPFGSLPLLLKGMFKAARKGTLEKMRLTYEDHTGTYTLSVPGPDHRRKVLAARREAEE